VKARGDFRVNPTDQLHMVFKMKKRRDLRHHKIPFIDFTKIKYVPLRNLLADFFDHRNKPENQSEVSNQNKANYTDQWGTPLKRKMNALKHFMLSMQRSFDLTPFEPNWCYWFYYNGLYDYVPTKVDVWVNPPFSGTSKFGGRADDLCAANGNHVLMLAPQRAGKGRAMQGFNFRKHISEQWSFAADETQKLDIYLSWYRFVPTYQQVVEVRQFLLKNPEGNRDMIRECDELIRQAKATA